jgi:hypothetical protein
MNQLKLFLCHHGRIQPLASSTPLLMLHATSTISVLSSTLCCCFSVIFPGEGVWSVMC